MRTTNRIIMFILVIVGIVVVWDTASLTGGFHYGIGPAFVPRILAILLIILSIVEIVKNEIFSKEDKEIFRMDRIPKLIKVLIIFVLYLVFMAIAGVIIPSILFFVIILYVIEEREIKFSLSTSIICVSAIYILFNYILNVPLPNDVFINFLNNIM